jgi:hypothetical protein
MAVSERRKIPVLALIALIVACVIWSVFTMRFEALLLTLFFGLALASSRFRQNHAAIAAVVLVIGVIPFSPYGVTTRVFPGSPRFVECCCCIPNEYMRARAAQDRGECVVCSDLVTGFEPRWHWVW